MMNGVSDIIGMWNATFLAIEVKTQTGRLSESQKEFQRQVIEHGAVAFTIRSLDEAIDLVRSLRICSDEPADAQ